ncbi:putative RNA-directed DNA polymerase, eukaryota, reverse transcriptase zinc-binding domain protein [Tanacetum coccineum]|uniref:RNA-directed DNA polymerase, eukaryota, reverse transcriptase zinc-binding domain protein n=1 Tax=Tanacetum coccineum TaxID=301880 RepID=A0ABQ5DNB6_9ASTR
MPMGSNSSFINLIPKVINPIHIKDFRPISIIDIHYKIIGKILANRLSKVVGKIVSYEQSTFIKDRQILNGPLILSEVIDWYKKMNKKVMLFKVDFEKAFDNVSWKYLDFMLHILGFGLTWRSWIKACLDSSRTSILINGIPTSEFNVKCGLRQGDPLSPFLFIIIMEAIYFFADDVVITTEWSRHDMDNIVRVFQVFFLASGLKINIHKSNIYGVGVSTEDVHLKASNTGCIAGTFPFTYLGLPIGCNMSVNANWKLLVDKSKAKLFGWKVNLLSFGGRLTLIKSVLGSLGGSQDSRKLAWMKWPNVVASFEKGGLNIGSLKSFNLALLHKWHWRMFSNPNTMWVKVIKALQGMEGGFDHNGLIRLEQDKDCLIKDQISNGQWARNWSSNLGIRNFAHLNDLLVEIIHLNIQADNDKCIWSMDDDGNFTVGALRRLIDDHLLPSLDSTKTWGKSLPRKVNFFYVAVEVRQVSSSIKSFPSRYRNSRDFLSIL